MRPTAARPTTPSHPSSFRTLLTTALVVALAACGPETPEREPAAEAEAPPTAEPAPAPAPTGDTVPAVLTGLEREEPSVRLPDTVGAGEAFTVVVESTGRNGCWNPGVTVAEVEGLRATVRPVDVAPAGDAMCTQALVPFTHEVVVRFDEPGEAQVVVEGRNAAGDPVSVTRTVTVTGG